MKTEMMELDGSLVVIAPYGELMTVLRAMWDIAQTDDRMPSIRWSRHTDGNIRLDITPVRSDEWAEDGADGTGWVTADIEDLLMDAGYETVVVS